MACVVSDPPPICLCLPLSVCVFPDKQYILHNHYVIHKLVFPTAPCLLSKNIACSIIVVILLGLFQFYINISWWECLTSKEGVSREWLRLSCSPVGAVKHRRPGPAICQDWTYSILAGTQLFYYSSATQLLCTLCL